MIDKKTCSNEVLFRNVYDW